MRVMMQKKIMCVYSVETEREIVKRKREMARGGYIYDQYIFCLSLLSL